MYPFHFTLQLRVIGYDSLTPYQRATADVTISVLRNVNSPLFQPDNYQDTIPEDLEVGSSILKVTATDADNVSYRIVFFGFIGTE